MKTDRYFSTNTLQSQIDYYKVLDPSSKASFYIWITATIAALFFLFSGFFLWHKQQLKELALLTKKEGNFMQENEELKENLHAYHTLKDNNHDLKNRMEQLCNNKKSAHATSALLRSVSLSIQEHTWISHLQVSNSQKNAVKQIKTTQTRHSSFSISAQTLREQEISPFTSALTQFSAISHVKVQRLMRSIPDQLSTQTATHINATQFHITGKIDTSQAEQEIAHPTAAQKALF